MTASSCFIYGDGVSRQKQAASTIFFFGFDSSNHPPILILSPCYFVLLKFNPSTSVSFKSNPICYI